MEIRALRADDDRSAFRSGDDDIDRFFHRFAGQNQFRFHIGSTYVAVEGASVAGFVTVSPGEIEIERLPPAARKRLPRYPLPILRLARLGVDSSMQGRGLGAALLRFVADLAVRMAQDYGCLGILVDAKEGAVAFYERYGFYALDVLEGEAASRPRPRPMFLSVGTIRRAAGPAGSGR
jgi:GNAT superfamily N-acetyltransferase